MTILKTVLVCATLIYASPAFAQTNISLGAISVDPSAAVEITADNLSVDQTTGSAMFVGNVVIGQGDLRISAGQVEVIYNGTSGNISRLSASGGVTFVTATEAAEATAADYNLDAGTLTLSGNVLLTQGVSAISADTMRVNLSTGGAEITGNVRTIFVQGDN